MPRSVLFSPISLRGLTLKNRIVVSPMCQYSAVDGLVNDWHLVHLGRFAIGGAALVFVEATSVVPEGRITHGDTGLWNDRQTAALSRITAFLRAQGAASAIQLTHAGRRASSHRPFEAAGPVTPENQIGDEAAWPTVGPSALPFNPGWPTPDALSLQEIAGIKAAFVASARRALAAGFDVVEVHAAHGYLLNQFLSPLSNQRTDAYGRDMEGRMRLVIEITEAIRAEWPQDRPVFVRISAVDGADGGWTLEDSVVLTRRLQAAGADVVDVSSGGVTTYLAAMDKRGPGYQVAYAETIRREAGIVTQAVGLILEARQAEEILVSGQADLIAMGRGVLWDANWPQHARRELEPDTPPADGWPKQVGYAVARMRAVVG